MSKRARNTQTWPEDWMPGFLLALRNSGNVRASCQAAGIDRKAAYAARKHSARFLAAWDDALEDGYDLLEAAARQRALNGSDFLLWRMLASARPEKYGDKIAVRIDYQAEAARIAAEHGLPPEKASKIVALAERLKQSRTG